MKTRYWVLTGCLCFSVACGAQDNPYKKAFDDFKQQATADFNTTKRQQMKEFAKTLKENWEKFNTEPPKFAFDKPKPKLPVLADGNKPQPAPTPKPAPTPMNPPKEQKTPSNKSVIDFYGRSVAFDNTIQGQLKLANGASAAAISDALQTLCDESTSGLIADCNSMAKEMGLNGWGYWMLTDKVAQSLCQTADECTLLQFFLLTMADVDVRLAQSDTGLLLLTNADCKIYGVPRLSINDKNYNLFHAKDDCRSIQTYQQEYNAHSIPVTMEMKDGFTDGRQTMCRKLTARDYPVSVDAVVDKSRIAFYRDYPQCDFTVYAQSAVDGALSRSILPPLAEAIKGKNEQEAANILLNFVQTAFEYQTDDDQFGYEKPFFVEECFYYPYCDCEDRAVLYKYLVTQLLHLDVVLLHYPNHLATAIRFTTDMAGDGVNVDGRKYMVCDPTYIGAHICTAMTDFKGVMPEIIK